jgi:hypothetical protein
MRSVRVWILAKRRMNVRHRGGALEEDKRKGTKDTDLDELVPINRHTTGNLPPSLCIDLIDPAETLQNTSDGPLEVERAEVNALDLGFRDELRDHRDRKLDAVLLDAGVVVLRVMRREAIDRRKPSASVVKGGGLEEGH